MITNNIKNTMVHRFSGFSRQYRLLFIFNVSHVILSFVGPW